MKKKLLALFGLALLLTVSCRQHDYRELTLNVPDMHNQACVQIVMQALSRGPGIKPNSVVLDPDKRIIKLTYDSLLSADKNFEYLVSKAGFAVNGIPADEKAKAALPLDARR
jgi:copper chaperone CopZ